MKKLFWAIVAIFATLFVAGVVVISIYAYRALSISTDPVVYYNPPLTTQFFDKRGELVANLFSNEHRLFVPFEKIPSRLVEALVAIEDTSFFEHDGINIEAIFRASYRVAMAGKAVEGASTITQQLVKNLLLTRDKTVDRKLKELVLSIKLEMLLSKEQIIERYLNEIYFGHGYYGIKTASLGYFRKNLDELTLKEMAMLAGLPRAPSFYDPTKHYKMSITRGNLVLNRMYTLGWISDTEYQESIRELPEVYDDTLTRNRAPYAIDAIVAELAEDYPDLRHGGYEVKTTLDMRLQEIATEAMQKGYEENIAKMRAVWGRELARYNQLINKPIITDDSEQEEYNRLHRTFRHIASIDDSSYYKVVSLDENRTEERLKELNGAMVTIDQTNGDLLALVGGVDYSKSVFNRAFQAKRQLGSSFKPFIYQAAFDLGYSPASTIADISRTYKFTNEDEEEKIWRPTNYEKNFLGVMSAREAVVVSRNLATINLVYSIGIQVLYDKIADYFGFKLPYDMAIALGSHSLTLLDFSEQLTTISNYGNKTNLRVATEVIDRFGNQTEYPIATTKTTEPSQAYLMVDVLRDTVNRGTGRRARVANIEIAGKTGTSNDYRDAWFIGFTPSTQTIVWFGNDDNSPVATGATGGVYSAPVFANFYKDALKVAPELKRRFDTPDGVREIDFAGKKEIFTDISKPPKPTQDHSSDTESEILF